MEIIATRYQSPFGQLTVASYGERLCMCDWTTRHNFQQILARVSRSLHADVRYGSSPVTDNAITQLEEYCAGHCRHFDLPLLTCGTAFQKSVWDALLTIPYGTTRSYSYVAALIGRKQSVRAVANAIGANAISIIIPCHRVIGSNGSLTGYAGGVDAKRRLLQCEHVAAEDDTLSSPFDRDHII